MTVRFRKGAAPFLFDRGVRISYNLDDSERAKSREVNKMEFERLKNTRDLGGLVMKDGRRILPGKLIRSSHFSPGTQRDLALIAHSVSDIVDFRTAEEQAEKPDPGLDGVTHHSIPTLANMTSGITREEQADRNEIETYMNDPAGSRAHMCENYRLFVLAPSARKCYSRFVELLAKPREKAILWHCSAGKDRAGFATAILLEILGADRATILEDYLKTNKGLEMEIAWIYPRIAEQAGGMTPIMKAGLDYMFTAREEYLESAYRAAEEAYGSMEGFLERGLGADAAMREKLQKMYLTD